MAKGVRRFPAEGPTWYGSRMASLTTLSPRSARSPTHPPLEGAPRRPRLFRYQPVPPVGFDADGYPCEDSAVWDEWHFVLLTYLYEALRTRFGRRASVLMDAALCYRRGDPTAVLAPHLLVAFDAPSAGATSYKLWERPVPAFVLEVLSKETRRNDLADKKHTYEVLGVEEYWLFDAEGRWLRERLVGHRLRAGRYQPVGANGTAGRLASAVLGLELRVVDGTRDVPGSQGCATLRCHDLETGKALPSYSELHRSHHDAEAARREADARAEAALAAEREADSARREAEAALREAQERIAGLLTGADAKGHQLPE